ncbi:MAG: hypothetical protein Q9168_007347 [Polycauliona sp. 1 TL-2023]
MLRLHVCLLTNLIAVIPTLLALPQDTASSPHLHDSRSPGAESNAANSTHEIKTILRLPNSLPVVHCDGIHYRANLKLESCFDAVNNIPQSAALQTFQQRGLGVTPDIALPWRYTSAVGTCIIEVIPKDASVPAQASYGDLRQAATALFRKCVSGERVGGIATDVDIVCYDAPRPITNRASCLYIVANMRVSREPGVFGWISQDYPDVKLPFVLSDHDYQNELPHRPFLVVRDVGSRFGYVWYVFEVRKSGKSHSQRYDHLI